MAGRECYHCRQWIEQGEAHDCWTTTEAALTQDLPEDLRDASCYFFVRPNKNFLEVCVFLGRSLTAPQVRRVDEASKSKRAHFIRITHRDEVEAPFTDWLREAYELPEMLAARGSDRTVKSRVKPVKRTTTAKPRKPGAGRSQRGGARPRAKKS